METFILSNHVPIPAVGFGTYEATIQDGERVIQEAIASGYRHFDTAAFYKNEEVIGHVIRESRIPREEFFITSKVWVTELGYEKTMKSFRESLVRLETDYIDLFLIHWPCLGGSPDNWKELDRESWKALEELYDKGKCRAIGVSNFKTHHLKNIMKKCNVEPMVNQIEFHPGYADEDTIQFCKENNIQVEAWSPLGRGEVLKDALIMELADSYHVTTGQICLRYAVQRGIVPLPKSSTMDRMKKNRDLFGFELSLEDMRRIQDMPILGYSGQSPDE